MNLLQVLLLCATAWSRSLALTESGNVTLSPGEVRLVSAVIDDTGTNAYFG